MQLKEFSTSSKPAFMTCEQLSGSCGMSMGDLGELVSYSALVPIVNPAARPETTNQDRWVFSAQWLKPLCEANKMRSDFDLDLFTVAIMLRNLQRIDVLEQSIVVMQQEMHAMACAAENSVIELVCEDRSQLKLFQQNH